MKKKEKVFLFVVIMMLIFIALQSVAFATNESEQEKEVLIGKENISEEVVNGTETGYSVAAARKTSLNEIYVKTWSSDNIFYDCYNKITVPENGILTFHMTKPIDAEGEYGRVELTLFDNGGTKIWENDTYYANKVANYYQYSICVQKGTYYLNIDPIFYVSSGNIETYYNFSFEKNNYIEIEPNEGITTATALKNGIEYKGNLDSEKDYFKFQAIAGKNVKIYIKNFEQLDENGFIQLISPTNAEQYLSKYNISYDESKQSYYFEFIAANTGSYYLYLSSFFVDVIPYTIKIDTYTPNVTNNNNSSDMQTTFKDVKKSDWFYNATEYCNSNKIITGYKDGRFAPNDKLSRGMVVSILYKMEGQPKVTGASKFIDIKNTKDYYYNAVIWASNNKIVSGYKNGSFGPNNNITREDFAVILYKYAKYKGKSVSKTNNLSTFSDRNEVSSYALPQIKWAVGSGVISGNPNGTLSPQGQSSRAEAAAMIEKYCKKIGR